MKVALCAIAKLENNYLKEWVEYHLKLGFDQIFLYDNNDKNGEHFEEVINDYIISGQVKVTDYRGRVLAQVPAFDHCYQTYGKDFDWMGFIDIDEFITLNEDKDIKEFLGKEKFNNYNCVYLFWAYFTDSGHITVENNNYNCLDRFTEVSTKKLYWDKFEFGKRLVRTQVPKMKINTCHGPIYKTEPFSPVKECLASGEPLVLPYAWRRCESWLTIYNAAYIRHFNCKTLQEYFELKLKRGYPVLHKNMGKDLNLDDYFVSNEITREKLEWILNWLNTHDIHNKNTLLTQCQELLKKYE